MAESWPISPPTSSYTKQPKRWRKVHKISKHQQPLLDHEDAWYKPGRPLDRGAPNVPPAILASLREARREKVAKRKRATDDGDSSGGDGPASPASPANPNPTRSLSWSPSPPSHLRPPKPAGHPSGQAPPDSSPVPASKQTTRPTQSIPTQEESPIKSPPKRRKALSRHDLNQFPSSQPESDLPYEEARGLATLDKGIFKNVDREATGCTPPSAQGPQATQATRGAPTRKPTMKKKELPKEGPKEKKSKLKTCDWDTALADIDRPPLIPDTTTSRTFVTQVAPVPTSSDSATGLSTRPNRYVDIGNQKTHVSETRFDCESSVFQSHPSPSAQPKPKSYQWGPASKDAPFLSFSSVYVSHAGSLHDFVRACVNIEELKRSRRLPSLLYDDFIRVFATDYVQYVAESAENGTDILPAVEWYFDNLEDTVFKSGVITKTNLKKVLAQYPDEVAEIRCTLDPENDASASPEPIDVPEVLMTQEFIPRAPIGIQGGRISPRSTAETVVPQTVEKPPSPTSRETDMDMGSTTDSISMPPPPTRSSRPTRNWGRSAASRSLPPYGEAETPAVTGSQSSPIRFRESSPDAGSPCPKPDAAMARSTRGSIPPQTSKSMAAASASSTTTARRKDSASGSRSKSGTGAGGVTISGRIVDKNKAKGIATKRKSKTDIFSNTARFQAYLRKRKVPKPESIAPSSSAAPDASVGPSSKATK